MNLEAEEEDRLLSHEAIGSLLKIIHEQINQVVEESMEAIRVFDKLIRCLPHLKRDEDDRNSWPTKLGEKMTFRRELGLADLVEGEEEEEEEVEEKEEKRALRGRWKMLETIQNGGGDK